MKKNFLLFAVCSAMLFGLNSHASADVIGWGAVTTVAGDEALEVSTLGTFEQGFNLGGDGVAATTVNGDTYAPFTDFSGDAGTFDAYPANNATTPGYEALLSNVDFRQGGAAPTAESGDLTESSDR